MQEEVEKKSLFEQLQENKALEEAKFAEYRRQKQCRKRVEEDDVEFFNQLIDTKLREEEEFKVLAKAEMARAKKMHDSRQQLQQSTTKSLLTHVNKKPSTLKKSNKESNKLIKKKQPSKTDIVVMSSEQSALLLKRQLKELSKHPVEGFSAGLVDDDNIYEWEVMIIGPPDTLYEGGFFKTRLSFPRDYPQMPPSMKFVTDFWHPNVYPDGKVCISILHPPGDDSYGYEKAEERWLPVHTVETILLSVISMLSSPNDESPANVEAAKEWRETPEIFKKKIQRIVRRSQEDF